jgi:hypothetical protein
MGIAHETRGDRIEVSAIDSFRVADEHVVDLLAIVHDGYVTPRRGGSRASRA